MEAALNAHRKLMNSIETLPLGVENALIGFKDGSVTVSMKPHHAGEAEDPSSSATKKEQEGEPSKKEQEGEGQGEEIIAQQGLANQSRTEYFTLKIEQTLGSSSSSRSKRTVVVMNERILPPTADVYTIKEALQSINIHKETRWFDLCTCAYNRDYTKNSPAGGLCVELSTGIFSSLSDVFFGVGIWGCGYPQNHHHFLYNLNAQDITYKHAMTDFQKLLLERFHIANQKIVKNIVEYRLDHKSSTSSSANSSFAKSESGATGGGQEADLAHQDSSSSNSSSEHHQHHHHHHHHKKHKRTSSLMQSAASAASAGSFSHSASSSSSSSSSSNHHSSFTAPKIHEFHVEAKVPTQFWVPYFPTYKSLIYEISPVHSWTKFHHRKSHHHLEADSETGDLSSTVAQKHLDELYPTGLFSLNRFRTLPDKHMRGYKLEVRKVDDDEIVYANYLKNYMMDPELQKQAMEAELPEPPSYEWAEFYSQSGNRDPWNLSCALCYHPSCFGNTPDFSEPDLNEPWSAAKVSCWAKYSWLTGCVTSPLVFCQGANRDVFKYRMFHLTRAAEKKIASDIRAALLRAQTLYDEKKFEIVNDQNNLLPEDGENRGENDSMTSSYGRTNSFASSASGSSMDTVGRTASGSVKYEHEEVFVRNRPGIAEMT